MNFLRLSLAVLLGALLVSPVFAEDKKAARDQELIRRLRQQVQQSQQEVEQAKAQAAQAGAAAQAAKADIDKARSEADRVRGRVGAAERRAATVQAELDAVKEGKAAVEAELSKVNARLAETQAKLSETTKTLQTSEANGRSLKTALSAEESSRQSCEKKNLTLYRYSVDLLTRYQNKGVWSALKQAEPFTGIKQVEIENIVEEYRDKLDAEKLPANTAGGAEKTSQQTPGASASSGS